MNHTKIFKILTVLFAAVLCFGPVGLAGPVGTAFTYQGRLIDANEAADGLYDFQFKLFDANNAGNKLGSDVNKPEVDVIDGYFTAELDFGIGVFGGDARWLEIGVRPGELEDPNVYTFLTPRQKITAAPYALYAKTAGSGVVDSDWIISGNNMYSGVSGNVGIGTSSPQVKLSLGAEMPPTPKKLAIWDGINDFYGFGSDWSRLTFYTNDTVKMTILDNGRVGIGTTFPERTLHIAGIGPRILIEGDASNPEVNFKLTNDPASDIWSIYKHSITEDLRFYQGGDKVVFQYGTGNVGIGATSPSSKLSVGGPGYANVGIYGLGSDYGIYGFSTSASGVGVFGKSDYGVYGKNSTSDNYGYLGGSNYGVHGYSVSGRGVNGESSSSGGIGVRGVNTSNGNYGYLGGSTYAVCGIASSGFGVRGESSENGVGVSGINNTNGNLGLLGAPLQGVYGYSWDGYGVAGHSDHGYGVYGSSGNVYGARAGYFAGNVYVTGEISAENVVDRTPYPKDLQTAYDAVMSMERLPDGQYEENNKEHQLDHSKLASFIQSDDGNRDLSATVSCLNEVVKDLLKKVETQQRLIETQNKQIQQLTNMLQTNNNLKSLSQQEQ